MKINITIVEHERFLSQLSHQLIILTESLCTIHSIRIWKRCLDCLRLKLKVFWIMQMISSFTWGRRVLGERNGHDLTQCREGDKPETSAQVRHPYVCPTWWRRFLWTVLPRDKWMGRKVKQQHQEKAELKERMDWSAMLLGRMHVGQGSRADRFPRGCESPEITGIIYLKNLTLQNKRERCNRRGSGYGVEAGLKGERNLREELSERNYKQWMNIY